MGLDSFHTALLYGVELPLIGLLAGVTGGLLGIGGGLVIIPALVILLGDAFGPGSLHVYKIAALATAIVLSAPAARQHARHRAVVWRMVPALELFALAGVVIGVLLAGQLAAERTKVLQRIFGACLMAFVLANVWLGRRSAAGGLRCTQCPGPSRWAAIGSRVGLPAGVISGLLGVGGGVWAVPAQHFWLGMHLRNAIANSTCMIVGVALAAAVFQSMAVAGMNDLRWQSGWWLAMFLSPGALVGGPLGAWLTHRVPVARLRAVFHALLVLTGLRLVFG